MTNGAAALAQADKGAIFFADMDIPQFAGYYLQNVEGTHKDVVIISQPSLWSQTYIDMLPVAIRRCGTR